MMGRHNIEPIPSRGNLPPEIAAIALPQEEGQPPLVILNAADKDPRATFSLFRPDLYLLALLGWLAERLIRLGREHIATTAITTVAAGSIGIVGASVVLDGDSRPEARPAPAVVTIVTTAPRATFTVTPEREVVTLTPPRKTSTPAPILPARLLTTPTTRPTERGEPSPKPTKKPTRAATPTPRKTPSPAPQETADSAIPPPSTMSTPSGPEPTSPPPVADATEPAPAEPSTAARQDCGIRVDVDPLLEVCLFG